MQNTQTTSAIVDLGNREEVTSVLAQRMRRTPGVDDLTSDVIGVNNGRLKMTKRSLVTCMSVVGLVSLAPGVVVTAVAANLFASVSQKGTLVAGSKGAAATKLGPGQYEVSFAFDVSRCAYVATTVNAYTQALQAYTAGGHLGSNGVFVETKNQGGGLTDGPFNLVVVCEGPDTKFAVVGYGSDLTRASNGTKLSDLGSGRYAVTFEQPVSTCAFVATVGDPGNALVYAPSGVYTGSISSLRGATVIGNPNTVYVETKNPGGGLQNGIPFHLAVICPTTPDAYIAVVNATGLIQRGSALASSFSASTGHFAVANSVNINPDCATVATRGSVDAGVPYTPATVEVVPGPAANTVGIDVRTLLAFGGNLLSESFHAATVCR